MGKIYVLFSKKPGMQKDFWGCAHAALDEFLMERRDSIFDMLYHKIKFGDRLVTNSYVLTPRKFSDEEDLAERTQRLFFGMCVRLCG